jgi:hypothetical protein
MEVTNDKDVIICSLKQEIAIVSKYRESKS